MGRAIRFVLPIVGALLVGCQTTAVSTWRDKYLTTWTQRLEQYKAQFVEKDREVRAKTSGPVLDSVFKDPDPWPRVVSLVADLSVEMREAYTIAGRGEALKDFLNHIRADPTPGLTDIWFVQQAQDLEREGRQLDAKGQHFAKTLDERLRKGPDWILETESLVKAQGMLLGRSSELQSLHKQAQSYFLDLYQAQAQDRHRQVQQAQAAQALFGMSAYLQQLNYQQQVLNTLNRPRTCTALGNTISCY